MRKASLEPEEFVEYMSGVPVLRLVKGVLHLPGLHVRRMQSLLQRAGGVQALPAGARWAVGARRPRVLEGGPGAWGLWAS